jgi:hypothetical protein
MTRLSINFTLEELLVSQKAAREGFTEQFEPPPDIVSNLTRLAGHLEIVRAILGSVPLIVTSGYRCQRVNDAVAGSSRTSAHMLGLAADFTAPRFGTPIEVCRRLAQTQKLEFDQVIYEYESWCHFAVGPGDRRQLLSKFSGDPQYHPGIIVRP